MTIWISGKQFIFRGLGSGKKSFAATFYRKFSAVAAWEGIVEVFELVGHQTAKRAYAWMYRDGAQNKTMTVLGVLPVDSPHNAVKIAIAK